VAAVIDAISVLLPTGKTVVIEKEQLDFSYRKLELEKAIADVYEGTPVILSGCFRLQPSDPERLRQEARKILRMRKVSQPLGINSAGCFYKNPPSGKSAGELIDLAGLKGKAIGGAAISSKHANFIINRKGASADEILALMDHIEATVSKMFDIDLEREVRIVGS
jgi:UDP-N-acetylmuramate dehydrogenase